jgi:lysine-specific demethylase 8/hypoxia-inducible factor 1-alpha inhibitor (HIF hydroxylase)
MNHPQQFSSSSSDSIERVSIHSVSPRLFYHEFQRQNKPVILTDAFNDNIPVDAEKLTSFVGEMEVSVRVYGPERFSTPKVEWKNYCEMRRMSVKEYCRLLRNGEAKRDSIYLAMVDMGATPFRQVVGPGIDLIAAKTGLRRQMPNDVNVWVGPGGHVEPLHYDGQDGTLSQFRGTKRVSLFPPSVQEGLYPFEMSHVGLRPNFSQVYIDKPDFEKHPLLRTALSERKTVELAEGETLYMPVGWWHEIEALGHDYICSVNRFWKVDPIWRYREAPQAGFLYGLAHLYQLKNKIKNSFSFSTSSR